MAADELVVIGRIGRPHGLHGDVRVIPTGPTLPSLRSGVSVVIDHPERPRVASVIAQIRPVDRAVLIRFVGVADREAAARLTGAEVKIAPQALVALTTADEFYVRDLVGCAVTVGDICVGDVIDIYSGAANDALVVRRDAGDDILIPFTNDAVVSLDLPSKVIVVREGLLGDEDR